MRDAVKASATTSNPATHRLGATVREADWRASLLVCGMVLLPVPMTVVLLAIGIFAIVGWQWLHGQPARIPSETNIRTAGQVLYAIVSWFDVGVVSLWSSRRGLLTEVLVFRKLKSVDLASCLFGLAIAIYGAPFLTRWLSHLTGGQGPGVRIRLDDSRSLGIYVVLFVITAPICEEILYRGLFVAWFRRAGWRTPAIWLIGSLIFGANHILFLGFVWGAVMVLFGALLFGLRLSRRSLIPGWIVHLLFNAQPIVILPLISRFAPALLP